MLSLPPDFLPRQVLSAIASTGYRARRWAAAREVLGNQVAKNRIQGLLGETLQQWGVGRAPVAEDERLQLSFGLSKGRLSWCDDLAAQPLERALLHLPALRGFWRQELRQTHFTALQTLVPKAWVLDHAHAPPGAVIHGLDIPAWDHLSTLHRRIPSVVIDGRFVIERSEPETTLAAVYHRDGQRRVVLRSLEALP